MADLSSRIAFEASALQKFVDTGAGDGTYALYGVQYQLIARPSATFTRPADTTAYTSGDLVANNVTAGSVTPMSFAVADSQRPNSGGRIRRASLRKTGTGISNASFRLHLYTASPTPANGDNDAWSTNKAANYIGYFDFAAASQIAFTDGAACNAVPAVGSELNFTSDTLYGLLEARGAYTPISGEVFTPELEVWRN
jgi:hypothetical protein